MPNTEAIALCGSADLTNGGLAVPFDVVFAGQTCRAFAIRYQGQVHGYLNRCAHVAMEMDFQPNRFFDISGDWLICATHGALYQPQPASPIIPLSSGVGQYGPNPNNDPYSGAGATLPFVAPGGS